MPQIGFSRQKFVQLSFFFFRGTCFLNQWKEGNCHVQYVIILWTDRANSGQFRAMQIMYF